MLAELKRLDRHFTSLSFKFLIALHLFTISVRGACGPTEFMCDGSACISIQDVCNGPVDCQDGSDESDDTCRNHKCGSGGGFDLLTGGGNIFADAVSYFQCAYGGCIPQPLTCNGFRDCRDGSDETSGTCRNNQCRGDQFRCATGACLPRIRTCDGRLHCQDGDDETEALCRSKRCRRTQFQCTYGACIHRRKFCDGKIDCFDGSDESGPDCATVVTPPPSPVTPTPIDVTPTPPPTSGPANPPGFVFPGQDGTLQCEAGLCRCQPPNDHVCVPCGTETTPATRETCLRLGEEGVCQVPTAEFDVHVDYLICGHGSFDSVDLFARSDTQNCSVSGRVPVLTTVLVNCWGNLQVAQCQADRRWHPYSVGPSSNFRASEHLCQPKYLNSFLCGRRGQFRPDSFSFPSSTRSGNWWPWLGALSNNGQFICVATFVNPQFLITAGHCITDSKEAGGTIHPSFLKVQRFNTKGPFEIVVNVYLHPRYVSGTPAHNDLAIIKLEHSVLFSRSMQPACIATGPPPDSKLAAAFIRTDQLPDWKQWQVVTMQKDQSCKNVISNRCAQDFNVSESEFCAKDRQSVVTLPQGSSGGPYLVNDGHDGSERWTVNGIISYRGEHIQCSQPRTVFGMVHSHMNWIKSCIENGRCF